MFTLNDNVKKSDQLLFPFFNWLQLAWINVGTNQVNKLCHSPSLSLYLIGNLEEKRRRYFFRGCWLQAGQSNSSGLSFNKGRWHFLNNIQTYQMHLNIQIEIVKILPYISNQTHLHYYLSYITMSMYEIHSCLNSQIEIIKTWPQQSSQTMHCHLSYLQVVFFHGRRKSQKRVSNISVAASTKPNQINRQMGKQKLLFFGLELLFLTCMCTWFYILTGFCPN